jgi:hypothetical protein
MVHGMVGLPDGSEEFRKIIAFNYRHDETSALMRKCWSVTPWVLDVFTGDAARERQIIAWCYERYGRKASPIHGVEGTWQRGNATIHGWTWMGFATDAQMREFESAWPSPNKGLEVGRALRARPDAQTIPTEKPR